MSNIYIKEPPTSGKVLLETSVGDIDIELWCKECPKACRNFIQLCMEGYYNKTSFHRLVPGFLIQGGDPTGSGDGGESVYGKPFKDEFHQRLKFERRGLLGMASVEPNNNTSQFFFTLGPAPELSGKNTMFGKVSGHTLYNMLELGETGVDDDGRPIKKHLINKTEILNNPFDDIEPRCRESLRSSSMPVSELRDDGKGRTDKDEKSQAVKNFSLLSFGDEAEEDEEENDQVVANQFKGKSKSAHDLLVNDPKLSKECHKGQENNLKRCNNDELEDSSCIQVSQSGLKRNKYEKDLKGKGTSDSDNESDETLNEGDRKDKLSQLKNESGKLEKELKLNMAARKKSELKEAKRQKEKEDKEKESVDDIYSTAYMKKYRHLKKAKAKTQSEKVAQQDKTMKMLAEFEAKLNAANQLNLASNYDDDEDTEEKEKSENVKLDSIKSTDSAAWMTHKFEPEDSELKQARDANMTRGEDEYEIFDPRNPMNKRRRENAKKNMRDRSKPLAGVKDLD